MKKKFLRWVIVVLGVVLALLIAALLSRDIVLKSLATRGIEEETGLRAVIGELTTTLGSGALHVRDLKLYNPPEFGGELMADIPEIFVNIDADQAANGKLHFRNLKLTLSELNIVKNAAGRLNLDGVEKRVRERQHLRRKRKDEKFEFEFAGLEQLQLTLRKVLYTDLRPPTLTRALDLAVKDEIVTGLKTEEELGRWAGGMMFRILMQVSLSQFTTPAPLETSASDVQASP
jgi:hypothetical protein